tara:strand:- start:1719 stop:2528 length:810 start_codon:yes stop_codon:yes gene_type:complete
VLVAACMLAARFACATGQPPEPEPPPGCAAGERGPAYDYLVLIIDDVGNSRARGLRAISLPGNITYAVMPFTPFGEELALAAQQAGREVMLHAPMSTLEGSPLGEGGLTPELSREQFRQRLNAALEDVPNIRGVNNHMGSQLTQLRPQMAWLMQELRLRDLYFVDSRTSDLTVAATVAGEFRVPHLSRQVFLDNERNAVDIAARFEELVARAQEEGIAVGIGHPYGVTIDYLGEVLPTLEERGLRTLFVSQAIEKQGAQSRTSIPCSAM